MSTDADNDAAGRCLRRRRRVTVRSVWSATLFGLAGTALIASFGRIAMFWQDGWSVGRHAAARTNCR
jgi:hypothetical protein